MSVIPRRRGHGDPGLAGPQARNGSAAGNQYTGDADVATSFPLEIHHPGPRGTGQSWTAGSQEIGGSMEMQAQARVPGTRRQTDQSWHLR